MVLKKLFAREVSISRRARTRKARYALLEQLERREVFDTTLFDLSTGNFSQDWSNTGLITTNNDWSSVPSITGYRGDDVITATAVDPQTVVGENLASVNVIANQTNPNTLTTGGIAEFEIADPVVALQGSGTADAPGLVIYLNATGRGNLHISYNVRDVDGSADNAIQAVALQYRVGTSGNFINVPAGFVADATTGGSATQVTPVSVTLPVGVENQGHVQVRILTTNATGNDEWVGIDDISITSDVYVPPSNPNFTLATTAGSALKAEGNSGSTSYSFTVTRDANTTIAASVDWAVAGAIIGGATAAASNDDFTGALSGTVAFVAGETSKEIIVEVVGDTTIEADEGFTVTLSNPLPSGATIGTGQGTASAVIANDDALQTLAAGDVVITAISTVPNPDVFSFVPLVDLVAGATVYFTDNGWSATGAAGSLGTAEGVVTFVAGASGVAKGTKIEIDLSSDQLSANVIPAAAGSATVSGTFALNSTGDSLMAYTLSPLLPTLLFGLNTGSTWTPASFSNSTTYLPTGLTIGTTAVEALGAPSSTIPQSQYNHTVYYGSKTTLTSLVADKANWVNDTNTTPRITIDPTNFVVGPAAIVSPTSSLTTTESGGAATFTIFLSTQPTSTVTIGLTSSNTSEGTVSPSSVVFDGSNWNIPQTVTVTGVDDAAIDGNVAYTIVTANAVSADTDYNNLSVTDVSVVNNDNDIPGVTVTPTTGLSTTESGATATFTVVLNSQPSADVAIALASSNANEGTPSPTSLTFTAANWNVPQTVTVTGIDDSVIDGPVAYTITTNAISSDANYNNMAVDDVSLTNFDNDRNTTALINELLVNPATGTDDPFEYVELIGTPGSSLLGYYFVQFEGDSGGSQGAADIVVDLSAYSFGSNGLLIIKAPAGGFTPPAATTVVTDAQLANAGGSLENGTVSSLLIYSPISPIVETTDYDANVGTLTLPAGSVVQDAVGWTDGGAGDVVYGGVTLTQSAGTPDAATRIVGDNTPNNASSWYNGDIVDTSGNASTGYSPAQSSSNLPVGAVITPGDTNYAASTNQPPVVQANSNAVSGNEGTTITNTGTWSDPNAADVVTLTASVGTVIKNNDGTWSWSISSTDNLPATDVTITADDGQGGTATAVFSYSVDNVAPAVARNSAAVSGAVLSTITNSGTYSDVPADTVTLSASVGSIVNNGNGTWSWSITPASAANNELVTITATDEDGGLSTTTFTYTALVTVTNRQVFYNNSGFETVGGVTAALDNNKVLLAAGATSQTTTFANVINYSRGINGVVLDVAGLASTSLTAADFTLRAAPAGTSGVVNPSTWSAAAAPSAIVVAAGSATTPARIQLEWTDNAIQNTWLQIIVRANANTGLASPAVFYLGHATAEVNGAAPYRVTGADLSLIQAAISNALVSVNDLRDINKDRRVTGADLSFVQQRISNTVILNNITIPAAGSTEEGAGAALPLAPTIQLRLQAHDAAVLSNVNQLAIQPMMSAQRNASPTTSTGKFELATQNANAPAAQQVDSVFAELEPQSLGKWF